jgi:prefoldin subunit 5
VIIVFELERQIERLKELRQLTRQLQAEAEQIRSTLSKIVESVGGKLVVGSYVLSLSDVMTVSYAKVLSALKESHPELSAEIDELVKQFQTVTRRLDIAEKQS